MYVVVSGGRAYTNRAYVNHVLTCVHQESPITTLIEGGARGADTLAREWATTVGVPVITVAAEWDRYGKAAGRIRNIHMLRQYAPELVIVFPGGVGTDHLKRHAIAMGFDVLCV